MAVRIPKAFIEESHVAYGTPVNLSVIDGKIVIEPRHAEPEEHLEDLLKGVTERNIHADVETGKAVGRDVW